MIIQTPTGRRAASDLARLLLELQRRGAGAAGRVRQIKLSLIDLIGTFDIPPARDDKLGPWFVLPSRKRRLTPNLTRAVQAWARAEV